MNNNIIWVMPSTGITAISVVNLADGIRNEPDNPAYGLNDEQFVAFCRDRIFESFGVPLNTPHRIVEQSETDAANWAFRSAWVDINFTVDMDKARTIHMANIRAIRDRELAAKDITFMRAVEAGNTSAQSTIATEKQNLRDIPQTFDITTGIDTPEKLKAKWPDGLPTEQESHDRYSKQFVPDRTAGKPEER